jgi:hypothetical protein
MPGPFSPPHESFKGSVEEWRCLTRKQRFDINNPGRAKMIDKKSHAKTKDNWKEWRDNPINKEKRKQHRADNSEQRKKKTIEWRENNPKKQKENDKKWRDQNPDKCRSARLRCDLKKQKNFDVMFHAIL